VAEAPDAATFSARRLRSAFELTSEQTRRYVLEARVSPRLIVLFAIGGPT
jgi:hypothetical protein